MQNAPNSLSKNLSVGQTEVLVHKQLFKMCISLQRGTQLFKNKNTNQIILYLRIFVTRIIIRID